PLSIQLSAGGGSVKRTAATTAMAAKKFPYEHVTHDECLTNVAKMNNPHAADSYHQRGWYSKNSFSLCWAGWIGEREDDGDAQPQWGDPLSSDARWWARMTIIVNTFVGKAAKNGVPNTAARNPVGAVTNSRQIRVSIRVDGGDEMDDDWLERRFKIDLRANGCTSSPSHEGSVSQWRNGVPREMVLNANGPILMDPDKVSICSILPTIWYLDNPDATDRGRILTPKKKADSTERVTMAFICDSAAWITAYSGGCIVSNVRPVFVLNANEKKKNKYVVRETAAHIIKALYAPGTTNPNPGTAKRIPGKFDSANSGCGSSPGKPSGCLHRTRINSTISNNRAVAIPMCRTLWSGYRSPQSCDEFPFASTHEGAASTSNQYSVELIDVKDNCSSGSRLGVWYMRNRIREGSPFAVDVIPFGQTRPISGAPGVIVTDPLPDEADYFDRCTIDGVGEFIGPIPPQ
ncbi:NucA/NucB deoxyribonuclease domain-containing protein, partial [Planomonospora parontospora]